MTVRDDLDRYVNLMGALFPAAQPPKELQRARALQRLGAAESVDAVSAEVGINRKHLLIWYQALTVEGLANWLGKKDPDLDRLKRAKSGIAQMLLGQLAEEHFEALSTGLLGAQGFRVEDQRVGRTDTDYRLLNPEGRPVCRLNIKFQRVHALRLRGFNQLFRGAEINMHLSLSREMIGYADFLKLLAERGPLDVAVRLDRGEI